MTANTEQVRRIIERHNANAVRCYAAANVDALSSIFAEDAWQMPPHQAALVGRSAIRQFWRNAVRWGKWDFTLTIQNVDVSEPMAVERGTYVLKFTAGSDAPKGMTSFEDRGNYLAQWRHESDGEWRIVADAPVSELPLPSAP
jgi:ketosteroid isomerase-like protein